MDLPYHAIQAYAAQYTTPEPPLLTALRQETLSRVPQPHMLAGHLQGRVLAMFSCLIQPRSILEIGTYTGYSALCLAEGLQQGGHLHTIERQASLASMAQCYFKRAGKASCITLHVGEALDTIPQITDTFDLVFIDADKRNYSRYYDLATERLQPGGWLLADNLLQAGRVLPNHAAAGQDKATQAITAFTKQVYADVRMTPVLLPIRDGLLIAQKARGI